MQRILEVTSVDISLIKTLPPQIHVVAQGTVPTSGWKNPALSPWFYIRPPDDGIQDFDFVAEEPQGIVFEKITPIAAEATIPRDPAVYWGPGRALRGVRIYARSNAREALFGSADQLREAIALSDHVVPWPWLLPNKPTSDGELIGKSLRVYHTGDVLTSDYRPDRANLELSQGANLIVRVWFG